MDRGDFDTYVLTHMPYFIAINYQRLLETQNPQERVTLILHIYNLGLRALTINLVNQYLKRDRDYVHDSYLEHLLFQQFRRFTPDAWKTMLFNILSIYEGNRDRLFMPELYDFYWDISAEPHRRRLEVEAPFNRLTQSTLEIGTKSKVPQNELGWKELTEELQRHLLHILQRLIFLGKYDLVLVLNQDERTYTFELHKGLALTIHRQPLPQLTLNVGCFYFRSPAEDFLLLDPWLVFGEWKSEGDMSTLASIDTGIYERLGYAHLWYLLAASGQRREGDKNIWEFIELFYDTLKNVEQQGAEKLIWVQLCNICKNITEQRMATVQDKYHKGLYLQRDNVHHEFEAFLADTKKRGFVLVGKSGVGKSNFLLAEVEELQLSRDDLCILMYDGANLPIASSSLTEIISKDFSDRVLLQGQQVQQVWHEIARIDGIDERQVIFCVDAINENPKATELLRQLDELVQEPWPWLKIVFSSRPETWKEIKRGIKLAESLYYQEQGGEVLGVELKSFSYSEQMEPFSRQELPEVYSKYQHEFQLQTPYNSLSHELRETLRDPLNLLLLAGTHRGQAIPTYVKASELIEQYVNALLPRADVRFLENQLVPLMVKEGHYSKVITEADLDEAGGALYEKIYSAQRMSDGRWINEAFLRLVDADILVKQEQRFEQQIAFKYERFYEYFVGKRISALSEIQRDQHSFYLGLIEETSRAPFLWGAVRNALVEEAKKLDSEMILKLCRTMQQRVKEMMVSVLVLLGQNDLSYIEKMLKDLLPPERKVTELRKGQRLLGKSSESFDRVSLHTGRIAIEVASNLGIVWVLQRASLLAHPTLRTAAVRSSYHLWQHNREAGFEVLEHLTECATHGFLLDVTALESAFGLSIVIFFEHYQDRTMLSRLQSIWHDAIANLLHIRERSNQWEKVIRGFIREQIVSFVINIVLLYLRQLPSYNIVSYQGLKTFFQLGPDEKELYRNLIQYMDVEGNYSKEQMGKNYFQAIKHNNLLVALVVQIGLVAHACQAPLEFLPFLKVLFEEAKNDVVSYPYLSDIVNVISSILDLDPMLDEVFGFYTYAAGTCQELYAKYPQTLRSPSKAPEATYLAPYIFNQYRRERNVRTDWLERKVQTALSKNNIPFFEVLITIELPIVGIESKNPAAALDTLRLSSLFNSENADIRQMIIAFLARLRAHYPDEVDDFLEEQQASKDFQLQVRTKESIETVGELVGVRGWLFLRDDVLRGPVHLRSLLMSIFMKAADCKNVQTWVDYFIRELINLIYGGEAVRQPV